ncbi:MAG: DUF4340 domain-containing protein [Firmicutes bacterium]|nr:DUF4340 domain-containing protein [Bacillota bacterium]
MRRKNYSTPILAVIAIILGLIAWWLMATQETAVNKNLVLKLSETEIIGFDIVKTEENQKIEKISVQRDSGNDWIITAPVSDITDPETISLMITPLKWLTTPSIIKDVSDLSEFGLDRPSLSVTIKLQKGNPVTINFGAESPIPEMYYAQVAGRSEVVVIDKDIKNNLSPKLSYLRERKVVKVTREQVKELIVAKGREQVYRMVNHNGGWLLIEPYRVERVANVVNAIIDGLNTLWTHENDDDLDNLSKYGLDQPDYRIELKLTDGKSFSLIANKIGNDYYMLNSLRPTIIRQKNPEAFNFLETGIQDLLKRKP